MSRIRHKVDYKAEYKFFNLEVSKPGLKNPFWIYLLLGECLNEWIHVFPQGHYRVDKRK